MVLWIVTGKAKELEQKIKNNISLCISRKER